MTFDYYKHLGVLAYSMDALRFFANTKKEECLRQLRTLMNCVLLSTENN